jgi:hypothetical protein
MKPNANTPKINKATGVAGLLLAVLLPVSQAHANLLSNGGFEDGNVGFSTDYVYKGTNSNYGPGEYTVSSTTQTFHGGFANIAAKEGSQMMVINGATSPIILWSESGINVAAHTGYVFSAWLTTLIENNGVELDFRINGVSVGTKSSGQTVDWVGFGTTWNSGNNTSVTLSIVDLNTDFGGNDLALDNIAFSQVNASAVPEPASLALVAVGLSGALFGGRRRRQAGR